MIQNKKAKDTRYLSLLNVFACFAVVCLHTNGCFWHFNATALYWKSANIIESLFYFAVPVFFMISGATLLDYSDRYSTKTFFVKRIKKTVLPFLFWSIVGLAFACFILKTIDISIVGKKYILNSISQASVVNFYWFFPPLFCIYLCMPLFSAVEHSKRKETFTYLAVFGYLINVFIPFVKSYMAPDVSFPLSVHVVNSQLIFVVIGYLLANYECPPKWRVIIYIAAIIALLLHIVGTYTLSMKAGTSVKTFKHIIISAPYASGIFLLGKTYGNKLMNGLVGTIVNYLKKYTFCIYLLHWFVIRGLNFLYPFNTTSILYRLGMPFVIIPVCILTTQILRKIPVIKHFVP